MWTTTSKKEHQARRGPLVTSSTCRSRRRRDCPSRARAHEFRTFPVAKFRCRRFVSDELCHDGLSIAERTVMLPPTSSDPRSMKGTAIMGCVAARQLARPLGRHRCPSRLLAAGRRHQPGDRHRGNRPMGAGAPADRCTRCGRVPHRMGRFFGRSESVSPLCRRSRGSEGCAGLAGPVDRDGRSSGAQRHQVLWHRCPEHGSLAGRLGIAQARARAKPVVRGRIGESREGTCERLALHVPAPAPGTFNRMSGSGDRTWGTSLMTRKTLLEVEHISKNFGVVQALKDVSFPIYEGEILALVGENGAGKSTLAKIIAGVHTQNEGRILYNGEELACKTTREARAKGIAIVLQEFALIPISPSPKIIFSHKQGDVRRWVLARPQEDDRGDRQAVQADHDRL